MKLRKNQFTQPKVCPYELHVYNFVFLGGVQYEPVWTNPHGSDAFDNSSDWWDEDKDLEISSSIPDEY